MDLADLYRKQEEDKRSFEATRQKVWDRLKESHAQLIAAFGTIDNLPDDMRGKIDRELEDFTYEWASDTGVKYQAMIDQHQRQFEETASISNEQRPKNSAMPTSNNNLSGDGTDREKTKQKLIAEQKAMLAKRQKNQHRR